MSSQPIDYRWAMTGAGLATLALWYWAQPSVPLPPGPRGHPIFGSALDLRGSKPFWITFAEYSERYGPLISFRLMFRRAVVINDPKIVTELFEKRAAQYSDRRVGQMVKLVGWEYDLLFLKYGSLLKHYRTLLQRAFNNRVVVDYLPLQEYEVKRMLRRLLETPEHFMRHIHLMAASVAIRMAYGYKVDSHDDPLVESVEKSMTIFADIVTPGRWMVDIFPALRYLPSWFPGMGFHKTIASWLPLLHKSQDEPFEFTKQELASGTAEPSFVAKLLNPESGEEVTAEEEVHIKVVASALYGAASDTTVSAIKSFFLAMLLYPAAQARAQAEIAAYLQTRVEGPVVGNESEHAARFITMADKPNLPYTSALVRELLRWHPIIPIVGHQSADEDDNNVVCEGKSYRIPARTPVLVNVWQIMHDPEVYTQPDKFMPERFLVDNPPPNPETYVFGFGRRICPGMHAAHQSMWLSISNILSAFVITKAKNENGEDIVPEEQYTKDIISHPIPFKCSIQAREGWGKRLMTFDD